MVQKTPVLTAAQFDEWVIRPENIERDFELISGEIVEKMVSDPDTSMITMFLGGLLSVYVLQHKLGRVTGPDGSYHVGQNRYIPDVGFIRKSRMPKNYEKRYIPAPDLAVEVMSPSDSLKALHRKISHYLAANIVVWAVYPQEYEVEIHIPGQPVRVLSIHDTIDGGDLLPDFSVTVKAIFEAARETQESGDTDA
jgi:Uma2 family endonuclease